MKVSFKYALRAGLKPRAGVFAVVLLMDLIFIIFGALDRLSFVAQVAAVSLGGLAIAVMMAFNIIGDVAVARQMFSAPDAYLYALTPIPRRLTILGGVLAMAFSDIVTMVFVIAAEMWLSLNMAGNVAGNDLKRMLWDMAHNNFTEIKEGLWSIPMALLGYLFVVMVILFSMAAKRSLFFKAPAPGFLSFLLACLCFYAASLLQLLLAPFGSVYRYGMFITITIGREALPFLILLMLLEVTGLYVLTSNIMERKMNI